MGHSSGHYRYGDQSCSHSSHSTSDIRLCTWNILRSWSILCAKSICSTDGILCANGICSTDEILCAESVCSSDEILCAKSICSTDEILCAERVLSRQIIGFYTDMIIQAQKERVFRELGISVLSDAVKMEKVETLFPADFS